MSSLFKYPGQTAPVKITLVKPRVGPAKPANRKKFSISFSLIPSFFSLLIAKNTWMKSYPPRDKRRRVAEEALNDEREARREAEKERKRTKERNRGATEKAYARKISVAREIGRSKERRRERTGRGRDEEGENGREKNRRKRGRGSPSH